MKNSVSFSALKHGLFLMAGLIMCSSAGADDRVVYESLPDVSIGRVFFSPQQRQRLDQRRYHKTTSKDRRNSSAAGRTRVNQAAAGYILSSSGKLQIYANGDFVAGKRQQPMHFPGDVSISRQENVSEEEAVQSQSAAESFDEDD